jgi:hypothetical protein
MLALPEDTLLVLISYLTPSEFVILSQTSSQIYEVANDPRAWRIIYASYLFSNYRDEISGKLPVKHHKRREKSISLALQAVTFVSNPLMFRIYFHNFVMERFFSTRKYNNTTKPLINKLYDIQKKADGLQTFRDLYVYVDDTAIRLARRESQIPAIRNKLDSYLSRFRLISRFFDILHNTEASLEVKIGTVHELLPRLLKTFSRDHYRIPYFASVYIPVQKKDKIDLHKEVFKILVEHGVKSEFYGRYGLDHALKSFPIALLSYLIEIEFMTIEDLESWISPSKLVDWLQEKDFTLLNQMNLDIDESYLAYIISNEQLELSVETMTYLSKSPHADIILLLYLKHCDPTCNDFRQVLDMLIEKSSKNASFIFSALENNLYPVQVLTELHNRGFSLTVLRNGQNLLHELLSSIKYHTTVTYYNVLLFLEKALTGKELLTMIHQKNNRGLAPVVAMFKSGQMENNLSIRVKVIKFMMDNDEYWNEKIEFMKKHNIPTLDLDIALDLL